jgi:hypothetical protein
MIENLVSCAKFTQADQSTSSDPHEEPVARPVYISGQLRVRIDGMKSYGRGPENFVKSLMRKTRESWFPVPIY